MRKNIFKITSVVAFALAMNSSYAKPLQVTLVSANMKHDGSKVIFTAEVKNIGSTRVEGGVCLRFYDKDNFEVSNANSNTVNFSPNAVEVATGSRSGIKPNVYDEIVTTKAYFSNFKCADSPTEAISNIIVIKK